MSSQIVVMLADDDEVWRNNTETYLTKEGDYKVIIASNFIETKTLLIREEFDIAIIDIQLMEKDYNPKDQSGIQLATQYALSKPKIFTTAFATFENLRTTLKKVNGLPAGVDFIDKTEPYSSYILAIEQALQQTSNYPILAYSSFGPANLKIQVDIFVIMPFTGELLTVYTDVIEPLAKARKLVVQRGDDPFTGQSIMDDVWSLIHNCQIVIGDCTGENPNVFYELGIAHTLGRPVIMITQDEDDFPFDIRHLRIIKYKKTPSGLLKLRKDLDDAVDGLLENWK